MKREPLVCSSSVGQFTLGLDHQHQERPQQALAPLAGHRKPVRGPVHIFQRVREGAQSIRAFARSFAKLTELPFAPWDERLTTAAVERGLIEADMGRERHAEVIDQHAAMFILQSALYRLAAYWPRSPGHARERPEKLTARPPSYRTARN